MTSLLEIALDPNTPSEQLQEIASKVLAQLESPYSLEGRIGSAIAQHPNTSPEMLLSLFSLFPIQVLNNAVLSLLLIEQNDFLEQLLETSAEVMSDEMDLPLFFLEWAVKHPKTWIRAGIANNQNLPNTLLAQLAQDAKAEVRMAVARNQTTSERLLEQLVKDEQTSVRMTAAENHITSMHLLEQLAKDKKTDVRLVVAEHPNRSERIMEWLSQDEDTEIRCCIARDPLTPNRILQNMVDDSHQSVRIAIAENPKTSPSLLEKLVVGCYQSVDWSLESNSYKTSIRIAQAKQLQAAIAQNPNTPIHILKQLTQQHEDNICLKAARNLVNRLESQFEAF